MASIQSYVQSRADGSQTTRFRVRYTEAGKLLSKSFDNREDAENFRDQMSPKKVAGIERAISLKIDKLLAERAELARSTAGMRSDGTPKTLCSLARDLFIRSRAHGFADYPPAAPETVQKYTVWTQHFASFFAGCYAEDITRSDARKFIDYCERLEVGQRQKVGAYSTVITMWNFLIGQNIVENNVFEDAKRGLSMRTRSRHIAAAKMERPCYSYDEAMKLWRFADLLLTRSPLRPNDRKAGERSAVMLKLLMATGLRRSELCGLKLDAFDPVRRQIVVRSTVLGTGRIDTVKSANSARSIHLHKEVADAIQDWIENRRPWYLKKHARSVFVFCAPDGKPLAGDSWHHMFVRLLRKAEMTNRGQHAFRHMVTSVLVDCMVDDMRIIRTLGHDNAEFSRSHYGHMMKHDGDLQDRAFIQEVCVASTGLTLEKLRMLAA